MTRKVRAWLWRLSGLFAKERRDHDLGEEFENNLELHIHDNLQAGMTPEAARRLALLRFGPVESTKESYRDRRGIPSLDAFTQDLRFAFRTIHKSPGFSAVAILTLALGIGATTAIFSVIDGVILRPLVYRDPDSLYVVHEILPQLKTPVVAVNALHFREWRNATHSFEDMALLSGFDLNLTGPGEAERIHAARVSPSLFRMLGVGTQLGRTFLADEDQPGRDLVVVLSHELWRRRFAEDPQIIGRTIALDGKRHTVIGVLPAGSILPKLKLLYEQPSVGVAEQPQLWTPFALWNNEPILAQMYGFACITRLRPGVTASQATADVNGVQMSLARQAGQRSQFQAALVPLHEQIVSRSRTGLGLLLASVVIVLIIGCVNIAHLLFARGTARRREMAIRLAIGATKGRLIWQMVLEAVLLSAIGGLVGAVAAYTAVRSIQGSIAIDVPRLEEVALSGRVLLFTVVTSIAAGLLSGVLPAWQLAKTLLESIKSESTTVGTTNGASRLRWLLVSLEVGVSTLCIIAGGLLLHSFVNVLGVDRGFTEERVVSVQLNVTSARYQETATRVAFVDRLLEGVRSLPGVTSAGSASRLPLSGRVGGSVLSAEGTNLPRLERPIVSLMVTDPGYFRTLGIPMQAGRVFDGSDRNRRLVAVVAASVADRVWPGQNPVGQRFRLGPDQAPLLEVVGAVGSIRGVSLTDSPTLHVYVPYWQSDMSLYSDEVSFVIRIAPDMREAFSAIRTAIREIDTELPVPALRTMEDVVEDSVALRRFQMNLVLIIAAVAMLLACLGIYGVVSRGVAQRTAEIGIRMALGAQPGDVQRLLFGQSLLPVVAGLAAGLIASLPLSRLLRSLLFGIGPIDWWTMGAAASLLWTASASAIYFPARLASQIDPLLALRRD